MPAPSENDRVAGIQTSLHALRRDNDLGIGDVRTLRQLIDWASVVGFKLIQIPPILEAEATKAEPGDPISSMAIDPLSLDTSPEGLADLDPDDYIACIESVPLEDMRAGATHFSAVRQLKMDILWTAFSNFWDTHYSKETPRDERFQTFCAENAHWLGDYCLFHLLMELEQGSSHWADWSEEYGEIERARSYIESLFDADNDRAERLLAYYAYIQWIADVQWQQTRDYADMKEIFLMSSLTLSVPVHSVEVFCFPQEFAAPSFAQQVNVPLPTWIAPRWEHWEESAFTAITERMQRYGRFFHCVHLTAGKQLQVPPSRDHMTKLFNHLHSLDKIPTLIVDESFGTENYPGAFLHTIMPALPGMNVPKLSFATFPSSHWSEEPSSLRSYWDYHISQMSLSADSRQVIKLLGALAGQTDFEATPPYDEDLRLGMLSGLLQARCPIATAHLSDLLGCTFPPSESYNLKSPSMRSARYEFTTKELTNERHWLFMAENLQHLLVKHSRLSRSSAQLTLEG